MHGIEPVRCKQVADFGLSRIIGNEDIQTKTHGTVSHMPPGADPLQQLIMLAPDHVISSWGLHLQPPVCKYVNRTEVGS